MSEPIKYWAGLEDTVRRLVKEGKNARDPEFKSLMAWFGVARIKAMVEKERNENKEPLK